jgi:hypothetical protein
MFTFTYMSLSQLGEIFGVSNQQVGKWLIELGLRTDNNKPSSDAFRGGYVEQMPSRNQGYTWSWHSQKTVSALEAAGHLRVLNPLPELVQPPTLNGPFSIRNCRDGTHQIVSSDGSVAVAVVGEQNAAFLKKVLNCADKAGVIKKHLAV